MQERRRRQVSEGVEPGFDFPPPRPENAAPARREPPASEPAERDSGSQGFEVQGVYIISVAARILDMHPQTLRKYERLGLIRPVRTVGMLRLYSQDDIRKILLIRHLMDNLGLNLAGVEFALALVDNLAGLQERVRGLAEDNPARGLMEREIQRLLRNLNLPAQSWNDDYQKPGQQPGNQQPDKPGMDV